MIKFLFHLLLQLFHDPGQFPVSVKTSAYSQMKTDRMQSFQNTVDIFCHKSIVAVHIFKKKQGLAAIEIQIEKRPAKFFLDLKRDFITGRIKKRFIGFNEYRTVPLLPDRKIHNSFRLFQTFLISGINVTQKKILLKKALFFYRLLLFVFPGCDLLLDLLYGVMKAVRIHRFQYIIRHAIADCLLGKSKISITAENDNFQIRIFLSCFF